MLHTTCAGAQSTDLTSFRAPGQPEEPVSSAFSRSLPNQVVTSGGTNSTKVTNQLHCISIIHLHKLFVILHNLTEWSPYTLFLLIDFLSLLCVFHQLSAFLTPKNKNVNNNFLHSKTRAGCLVGLIFFFFKPLLQ